MDLNPNPLLTFIVPIYRFFNKEAYADSMVKEGKVYFNTIKAFNSIADVQFRDDDEGSHLFKIPTPLTPVGQGPFPEVITAATMRKRKISDAWAFCGSCSPISKARKQFAVRIEHPFHFLRQLDYSIKKKFNLELPILFGPVSYYDEKVHMMTMQEQPPYFSKNISYKDDLEFRIVIIPPEMQESLLPVTLEIPDPASVFSKPKIF